MNHLDVNVTLSFGGHIWRVLDRRHDAALLITETIIEQRPYHDAYVEITWADCALRRYLNGEFLDRFSAEERSRIIPVTNQNHDNQWYGTRGGEDTLDHVFLLSIEEAACKYFGDSSANLYNREKNKRYLYWFHRKDINNGKRIARCEGQDWGSWWWLRSPGRFGVRAAYIHGDGNIGIQGNNILIGNRSEGSCKGGVRPVLWLRMDS